jgi:hypothetical protein
VAAIDAAVASTGYHIIPDEITDSSSSSMEVDNIQVDNIPMDVVDNIPMDHIHLEPRAKCDDREEEEEEEEKTKQDRTAHLKLLLTELQKSRESNDGTALP